MKILNIELTDLDITNKVTIQIDEGMFDLLHDELYCGFERSVHSMFEGCIDEINNT